MKTWDEYFIDIARAVSERSKDPSTQCGAVIVRPDKSIASTGYNGFPRDIEDKPEFLADRQEKLVRIIHAEMNAILTAREPLRGHVLYTWPFLTCDNCAKHVIQVGISRVVAPAPSLKVLERWGHSFNISRRLYSEAGVNVTEGEARKSLWSDVPCPFCGHPDYQAEPVNSHYETTCCHQTLTSCCEGPVSILP